MSTSKYPTPATTGSFAEIAIPPTSTECLSADSAPGRPDKDQIVPATRHYSITVLLNVVDVLPNEPGIGRIRSHLSTEEERDIVIVLQKNNVLISRSMSRAATLGTKFYVGLLLSEYIWFWRRTEEGRSIHKGLQKAVGITPGNTMYWTVLSAVLAASSLLLPIEKLPIFGPNGSSGPYKLFNFDAVLRVETQILGWQPKCLPTAPQAAG